MRKLILTVTGCMCLAGATYFLDTVWAQDKAVRKEAPAEEIPHKIALIDMEYVFKNYEKLKFQQDDLKSEAEEDDKKLKAKFKKGQDMAAELKDFKQDTPEYDARVQKIQKLETDLKFEQKQNQMKLQREVAKMNLAIYHEVRDVVEKFCTYYNYTLVIQFSRNEANSSDPNRMMQIVSQQVVYYRKGENGKCRDDLSEPVVKELNKKYLKASGADTADTAPPKKVKPAGGTESPAGTKRVKTAD